MATHRYVNQHDDRDGVYYSDAVDAAGTLYVSGCMPETETDDVEAQVTEALASVIAMVELAGYTVEDVAKLTIYLTDMADVPALTSARAALLGSARPATTTVAVASLYRPWMRVEIDAVAVRTAPSPETT